MPLKVSGLSIVCLPLLFSEMFGILLHTLHPLKNSRGCMAFSATEKQACSLSKRPTRQGRSDLKSDTGIVACPQPGELAEILLAFACFIRPHSHMRLTTCSGPTVSEHTRWADQQSRFDEVGVLCSQRFCWVRLLSYTNRYGYVLPVRGYVRKI
uniref:Putative transmembrane protein n=1 Tax=Toxoplasma gondii COUG TaxID=1074873 RepID=A0A2G8Y2A3_TOXGO|nr:putative transmembrane protein [Toxoplasma gondii COUG]